MKTHTSNFKEQIKLIGKEIDSRITFGETVLGKDDLNAVTPSYQGAILKSVMKQLDIDSNVEIPIGTILKYEFGLKVNGEYEYINYGNYVVYSIEKQEDTNSYKITCYDKLLYSMLDYVKLPITYPISIRDYINSLSTILGLKFANKSDTFANYDKQIQADLYDGLGYTFRDILDELAQVTASTICLNNNDELEVRYITETGDTIDEEFLKDVNINFGEKFGAVNTIVLSRSADSDSVYYPEVLPENPYEIKISDNQIMNGNDRADFLPDIYDKLNGLEFYTNDFVSTGIVYYDLCDRYSVKVGDNTYSCVMFNDEVLVTQGLEENIYTELPEQTETDYKHASKDDRMINQVYIIAKKAEAEILAVVNTTKELEKEINPTKDESGSEIIIEDGSNRPLNYLEIEGKSTQETRSGKNIFKTASNIWSSGNPTYNQTDDTFTFHRDSGVDYLIKYGNLGLKLNTDYVMYLDIIENTMTSTFSLVNSSLLTGNLIINAGEVGTKTFALKTKEEATTYDLWFYCASTGYLKAKIMLVEGTKITKYEAFGKSPSPDYPSEIESLGFKNLFDSEDWYNKMHNVKPTSMEKIVIDGFEYLKVSPDTIYLQQYMKGEFKENTQYTINCKARKHTNTTNVSTGFAFRYTDGTTQYTYVDTTLEEYEYVVTSSQGKTIEYIFLSFYYNNAVLMRDIMMTEGDSPKKYIPYGKYGIEVKTTNATDANTSLIVLSQPLRSLPNGTKDIAYIKNNRLYVDRKVGSVVLNGSENWAVNNTTINGHWAFHLSNSIFDIKGNTPFLSNNFTSANWDGSNREKEQLMYTTSVFLIILSQSRISSHTVNELKNWLSNNNTQVDYELAEPYTEELGEIETLTTFKGYNKIKTTDDLKPTLNIQYIRDTVIADYVENHVTELKLNEEQIRQSVETVSSSVDGLTTDISRVEQITTDNSQVLNIISTNIDKSTGEVREVTTTTGFTFNAEGSSIKDSDGFEVLQTPKGAYYKDNGTITGQYTKDGSKQKDLELFGTYSYGKTDIDDTPMFVGQLYTDENGEETFGHFYNGGDY